MYGGAQRSTGSANNENINLQQQRDNLQQELEAVRESRASAEARATVAERARRLAVTERSALRTDVERFAQQSAVEREKGADEVVELRLRNAGMAAHVQSLQTRLDMVIRAADETVYALQVEIITLRSNQVSRTRDLENVLAREDQTQTTFRRREARMRQVRRFKQKQMLILKIKLHDEARRADAYKKSSELYEYCLAELDPTLKGSTQTIHDPLKKSCPDLPGGN